MTNIQELYQHYLQYPKVCIDTRTIANGCLFFALKGQNFDANTFAEQALAQGAAFAIIDDYKYAINDKCILVPDVLTTLQDLAKYHRKQLAIPVIGLTGSNGKTTTKELINTVLAEQYQTFATKGNLNNHIGVPLSVLAIQSDVEIAVIEMGANHQKEIEFLCEIAQPTHGLITNIGMAHLEGFGGIEGVKKGKGELYAYLKKTNGYAFINKDNPSLKEIRDKHQLDKIIYYGLEKQNAISGRLLHSDPFIEFEWSKELETYAAKANLTGTYNFENILAAICIGDFFNLTPAQINKGLADYFPNNNRSQLTKTENNTLICDFYNANPSSMVAALNNLKALSGTQKTAIVGDMFELGAEAAEQHEKVIKTALQNNINQLIFIGQNFYAFKDKYKGNFFATPAEAYVFLTEQPIKGNLVLLKGSRGVALEQLLPLL